MGTGEILVHRGDQATPSIGRQAACGLRQEPKTSATDGTAQRNKRSSAGHIDAPVAQSHTLGFEPLCVIELSVRDQPTIGRHDTPPRMAIAMVAHDRANTASCTGFARFGSNLAVRHNIAEFDPINDSKNGKAEFGQRWRLPRQRIVTRWVCGHYRAVSDTTSTGSAMPVISNVPTGVTWVFTMSDETKSFGAST